MIKEIINIIKTEKDKDFRHAKIYKTVMNDPKYGNIFGIIDLVFFYLNPSNLWFVIKTKIDIKTGKTRISEPIGIDKDSTYIHSASSMNDFSESQWITYSKSS